MIELPVEKANIREVLKVVEIPESIVSYVQRVNYEMEGYKAINKIIITSVGEFAYNKEIYAHFMKEFSESNKEFRLAMQMLNEEYAPEFKDAVDVQMAVDFINAKLTFYREINNKKGCSSCQ